MCVRERGTLSGYQCKPKYRSHSLNINNQALSVTMATNDQERTDRECMCGCPRLLSAHGRDEHERSAAYLERVARVCFNCNRRGCAIKCNICRTAFFCSQACFNHSGEKHLAECQEMHDSVVASGGRACFYSCVPAELGEPVHLCTSRNCEIMHGQRMPPDAMRNLRPLRQCGMQKGLDRGRMP